MVERNEAPLLGAVNQKLNDTLKKWQGHPYSSEFALSLNTLIGLCDSAGMDIRIGIDKKVWDKSLTVDVVDNGVRYFDSPWEDNIETVVILNKVQLTLKNKVGLNARVLDNPGDEYSQTEASFDLMLGRKRLSFEPSDIKWIQIYQD